MTLEQLLMKERDGVLLDIQHELSTTLVPASGYAHAYCRKVNKMIDAGDLCINPTTYRKVYLPTLSRAVHKELARRWSNIALNEKSSMSLEDMVEAAIRRRVPHVTETRLKAIVSHAFDSIVDILDEAIDEAADEEM